MLDTEETARPPHLPGNIEFRTAEDEPYGVDIELKGIAQEDGQPIHFVIRVDAIEFQKKGLAFLLRPGIERAEAWLKHFEDCEPHVSDLEHVSERGVGPEIQQLKRAWLYARGMSLVVARMALQMLFEAAPPALKPLPPPPPADDPPAPQGAASQPAHAASTGKADTATSGQEKVNPGGLKLAAETITPKRAPAGPVVVRTNGLASELAPVA